MGRIAEGIEDSRDVVGNCLMHVPGVLCGNGQVLGKASVAVDPDAYRVRAEVASTRAASPADTTPDVALCGHPFADLVALHRAPHVHDFSDKFVSYNLS